MSVASIALLAAPARAHSFGQIYNLPVPFWLYGFGATAALVLSFLVVCTFVAAPSVGRSSGARDIGQARWVRVLRRARFVPALRGLSVVALLLCIVSGFIGTTNLYGNINMTLFWVVFMLGFAYATALFGDLYAAINPWRGIVDALARVSFLSMRGRFRYPPSLGYWPALLLYMGFIWIELFGRTRPFSLAVVLLVYTGINLAGAWCVGASVWFRHAEFLSVFLRLIGLLSPFDYRPDEPEGSARRLRLRPPFSGALRERAGSPSLLLFVLFMLSSTAFDGLRETEIWVELRWTLVKLWSAWTGNPEPFYLTYWAVLTYDTLWLLASPFLYMAVYLLFVWLARRVTDSSRPMREFALDFAYPLLPIAVAYHVAHYFTLILTQGMKMLSLVSDPFGWDWNLFGTLGLPRTPIIPDMAWVWHGQVALILLGHVAGVYLSHVIALRVFATRAEALRSQVPMLGLMVVFTVAGLWFLSLPIRS